MSPALLEDLLGTRAKVRILRELCLDPSRRYSGNALARAVEMSPNTVHRALDELADLGVIDVVKRPGSHDVRLAEDGALASELRRLFEREGEIAPRIVEALRDAVPEEVTVVVFGSVAEGTAGAGSDVDVLIVAPSYDRAAEVGLSAREAIRDVVPLPVRTVSFVPSDLRRDWDQPYVRSARKRGLVVTGPDLEAYT